MADRVRVCNAAIPSLTASGTGSARVRSPAAVERCGRLAAQTGVGDADPISRLPGRAHASPSDGVPARYRIDAPEILAQLGTRRPGVDGILALDGKTYARIGDGYVEIAPDRASTRDRPLWKVLVPSGVTAGITGGKTGDITDDTTSGITGDTTGGTVGDLAGSMMGGMRASMMGNMTGSMRGEMSGEMSVCAAPHRLYYDRVAGLWRRAEAPGLRAGGRLSQWIKGWRDSDDTAQAAAAHPFHDVLASHIHGAPSPAQIQAVRALLARLEHDPQSGAILRAMRMLHELLAIAPRIVLRAADDAGPSRQEPRDGPQTPRTGPQTDWNLDVDAMNRALDHGAMTMARQALAAVYESMTGVLSGERPFQHLVNTDRPPLDARLERAWDRWAGPTLGLSYVSQGPRAGRLAFPSDREALQRHALITSLRNYLREAHCYGGLDRYTFAALLKGELDDDELGLKIALQNRSLRSIPPLPAETHYLDISRNRIEDWRNLPHGLKILRAECTGGKAVLDHLPSGLIVLDVSVNDLNELPPSLARLHSLKRLAARNNRLTSLPILPGTVQELSLYYNAFTDIPERLPPGIRTLGLGNNRIRTVRRPIPATLTSLSLADNGLQALPDLSATRLEALDLSRNGRLGALPRLPASLEILSVSDCRLQDLGEHDLPKLTTLSADRNQLVRLPDNLPTTMRRLTARQNRLERLPANIGALVFCTIHVENNPLPVQAIPRFAALEPMPRIFFSMEAGESGGVARSASLPQAVRQWMGKAESETVARWDALGLELEKDPARELSIRAFHRFLDRLRGTASYRDAQARADVVDWLGELALPERRPLLEDTLQCCVAAAEGCEDRIALVLNQLRKLRLHDDIRQGRYNDRTAEAVAAMRELFRLDALETIATRQIAAMQAVDDVEVYLAYTVKLREALSLHTVVPEMRYFHAAHLTQNDLDAALHEVQEAERAGFYRALVIDDTWNALLRQTMSSRWQAAQDELLRLAGAPLQGAIQQELAARDIPASDRDAYHNVHLRVWRRLQYEVLEPLTRDFLAEHGVPLPAEAGRAPSPRTPQGMPPTASAQRSADSGSEHDPGSEQWVADPASGQPSAASESERLAAYRL